MREATSSSSRSRGVSSSNRTSGSISGLNRTTLGATAASVAETRGSRERKPRSPRPRQAVVAAELFTELAPIREHDENNRRENHRPICHPPQLRGMLGAETWDEKSAGPLVMQCHRNFGLAFFSRLLTVRSAALEGVAPTGRPPVGATEHFPGGFWAFREPHPGLEFSRFIEVCQFTNMPARSAG